MPARLVRAGAFLEIALMSISLGLVILLTLYSGFASWRMRRSVAPRTGQTERQ